MKMNSNHRHTFSQNICRSSLVPSYKIQIQIQIQKYLFRHENTFQEQSKHIMYIQNMGLADMKIPDASS